MSHIAILHPQCARLGGAIQMALQTAQILTNQGHRVTLYTFEHDISCFPDLQQGISISLWKKGKNVSFLPLRKLIAITTLAWQLRHVDIIIANNPPMQIVAALVKAFVPRIATIWWHHHIPWYLGKGRNDGMTEGHTKAPHFLHYSLSSLFILFKGLLERFFVVPNIDEMIATSHFIAEKVQNYCGRESKVIHPIIQMKNEENEEMNKGKQTLSSFRHSVIPSLDQVTLFTHGRLEAGKGLDMIIRVFQRVKNEGKNINLIVFGRGSLESELRKQGIDVRPFDRESTFPELLTGKYGHILGVYCSEIDGFGMAPLESQMVGFSTVILDRAGARETIVTNVSDEPVGYLVESEDELFSTICTYMDKKVFPKKMSNVNFYHHKDYFSVSRLSSDLLSIINKTQE